MALALIGGAALGTVFGVLCDVVKEEMGRTTRFKSLLGSLQLTLDSLQPFIIQQIGEHNVKLSLPNEEIESLKIQMQQGANLVRKLSKPRSIWLCYNCVWVRYAEGLADLDGSLRTLIEKLKLHTARDVKEILFLVRQTAEKLVEIDVSNKRLLEKLRMQDPRDVTETLLLASKNAEKLADELESSNRRLLEELKLQHETSREFRDVREAFLSVRAVETLRYSLPVSQPILAIQIAIPCPLPGISTAGNGTRASAELGIVFSPSVIHSTSASIQC